MKKKTVALLLACVMALGVAIGGTMAWLTAGTDPVENTFTVGDINIDLIESDTEKKDGKEVKGYDFVPGDTLAKDPQVIVKAKSEDCYLFIKVTETNNTRTDLVEDPSNLLGRIINWSVRGQSTNPAEGWVPYTPAGTVDNGIYYYYRTVTKDETNDQSWYILNGTTGEFENGCVTVDDDVTKAMRDEANTGIAAKKPALTFDAAAVQKDNIADVTAAWAELPATFKAGVTPPANP